MYVRVASFHSVTRLSVILTLLGLTLIFFIKTSLRELVWPEHVVMYCCAFTVKYSLDAERYCANRKVDDLCHVGHHFHVCSSLIREKAFRAQFCWFTWWLFNNCSSWNVKTRWNKIFVKVSEKSKRANIHILDAQMKKYSPPNYMQLWKDILTLLWKKEGFFFLIN